MYLFFFQAEDGIRDVAVTGVQTCALPILLSSAVQSGGQERQKPAGLALDKLELRNVKAEAVHYLGRSAMRVTAAGPDGLDDSRRLAVVPGSSFQDGDRKSTRLKSSHGYI